MIRKFFSFLLLLGVVGLLGYGFLVVKAKDSGNTYRVYFFYNEQIYPVVRPAEPKLNKLKQAVTALQAGPSNLEKRKGLITLLPQGLSIKRMLLRENGLLELYCSPELLSISGGNLSIEGMLAQFVYTATQFSNIKQVSFRIEGRPGTTLALGGEGYIIDAPLDRKFFKGRDQ